MKILVWLVLLGLVYPGVYSLEEPVVVVANAIDTELNTDFIDFLRQEREVICVQPAEFESYKTSTYLVILGGNNAAETGDIVTDVLADTVSFTTRMMITQLNVWQMNQVVIILAGPDREQTEQACNENKEAVAALFTGVETVAELLDQQIVFLWLNPITLSDTIAPYGPTPLRSHITDLPHIIPYPLKEESWFFWIDDLPYAKYAHTTRFIFFGIKTKTYTIHQEQWWPVLNGTSLWVESREYWNSDYWVYNGMTQPIPVQAHRRLTGSPRPEIIEPTSSDRALLINGWSTGQPFKEDMAHDIQGMQEALTSAGMQVNHVDTITEIQEMLQRWAKSMDAGNVVVYITAHGGRGYFLIGGTVFTGYDLITLLNTYKGVHLHIIIDACYAGSLIDPLQYVAETIVAAASEAAYGDVDSDQDPNPHDTGSEFTGGFVEGITELLTNKKEWTVIPTKSWYTHLFTEAFRIAKNNDVCAQKKWTVPQLWVGTPEIEVIDKPEEKEESSCPCGK